MSYLLAKTYNRAYDFFLFRYLKENGIDVGEDAPFEQIEDVALGFQNDVEASKGKKPSKMLSSEFRLDLPPPKRLLHDYAGSWKMEPGPRPSTIYYLEGALGERRLDSKLMKNLELQLPPRNGRLVFSDSEAAADISNFYRSYITDPLRRDIEKSEPKTLLKYFTMDEMKGLPDIRVDGQTKLNQAVRERAIGLQEKLSKKTPEAIANDIKFVLDQHWKGSAHPRFGGAVDGYESCHHKSESVELFCTRNTSNGSENVTLRPARGFLIWLKDNRAPQYVDVTFPQYLVYRES